MKFHENLLIICLSDMGISYDEEMCKPDSYQLIKFKLNLNSEPHLQNLQNTKKLAVTPEFSSTVTIHSMIRIHPSIHPFIHGSTALCCALAAFQFLNPIQSVGLLGRGSARRRASTYRTTQTRNKRTQTSMPLMGFESTTTMFWRAKTVHALDRAATMIDTIRNRIVEVCHFRNDIIKLADSNLLQS
jgi:hypothetical protein